MWQEYHEALKGGDFKSLARAISHVENETSGYDIFLSKLELRDIPVVGITGPPGAGKSTVTDALIAIFVEQGKKVAVLCVDPSSPFNLGALLGDRIRMSRWYNSESVFIRSLATRGSLGGLNPGVIAITDLLRASFFDIILIETVGVGQTEIEIAGLADTTVVVLVPESGDEVQTMKAGLMEIADIFVINKSDRPGAELFAKNVRLITTGIQKEIPVIPVVAIQNTGIPELYKAILNDADSGNEQRKRALRIEKTYQLIQNKRMKDVDKNKLAEVIKNEGDKYNMYEFVNRFST